MQASIYESVFEGTSLLEYPGHTKYVEGYKVFNFPTIRPSAYLLGAGTGWGYI